MDTALIALLLAIAVAAIVAFPLAGMLRRHSWAFYLIAAVITAAYAWATLTGVNLMRVRVVDVMLQKAYVASLLLAIVMFVGVLDEGPLKKRLLPIRGELSILSFILYLCHLVKYLPLYLPMFSRLIGLKTNIATSLVIAMALTVIFAVLGVTSFKVVRAHMSEIAWKRLQRFSYLMVALLLAHVALVMGKSALADPTSTAAVSLLAYAVIVVAYAVLRVRKAILDKKRQAV